MAKWSKIIQISLVLMGIVSPNDLDCRQVKKSSQARKNQTLIQLDQPQAVLSQKQDPQEWYRQMMEKYPGAGLEHVEFESGDHWSMFSYSSICHGKEMHVILCPSDVYHGLRSFTAADEGSLLHEAGHVRNHMKTKMFYDFKRQTALKACLVAACFFGAIERCKNLKSDMVDTNFKEMVPLSGFISKILFLYGLSATGVLLPFATSPLIGRLDEVLADNFRCQHADADTLKGSYYHFMDHAKWQKSVYGDSRLLRWADDFEHPASINRAQKIKNALWQRFGETV